MTEFGPLAMQLYDKTIYTYPDGAKAVGWCLALSSVMMVLKGFDGPWTASVITAFRFILLFSYLVPISLRVNLDMSKIFYCKMIERDKRIPGELF